MSDVFDTRQIEWCATHDAVIVHGSRQDFYGPWCVKGTYAENEVSYATGGGVDSDPCVPHSAIVIIGHRAGPPARRVEGGGVLSFDGTFDPTEAS